MHIYLVRHTKYHNPNNIFPFHLPVYLSEEGRAHARKVAEWFVSQKLLSLPIISSPIVRCVQTAEIIASRTDSFVSCDERLIETSSPGIQGTTQPDIDAWKVEEEDPTRESQTSIRERVASLFDEKVAEGKDCIFVSHGDPMTMLYYHLVGQEPPEHMWRPENSDHVISRGEIVEVEITGASKPKLNRVKVQSQG